MTESSVVPAQSIESIIFLVRGQKVILDSDLARLYGVDTKTLKRAVKRNRARFPGDFMFELTADEAALLIRSRYQTGTLKRGGNVKY